MSFIKMLQKANSLDAKIFEGIILFRQAQRINAGVAELVDAQD